MFSTFVEQKQFAKTAESSPYMGETFRIKDLSKRGRDVKVG